MTKKALSNARGIFFTNLATAFPNLRRLGRDEAAWPSRIEHLRSAKKWETDALVYYHQVRVDLYENSPVPRIFVNHCCYRRVPMTVFRRWSESQRPKALFRQKEPDGVSLEFTVCLEELVRLPVAVWIADWAKHQDSARSTKLASPPIAIDPYMGSHGDFSTTAYEWSAAATAEYEQWKNLWPPRRTVQRKNGEGK
jgi:hypothetical protein